MPLKVFRFRVSGVAEAQAGDGAGSSQRVVVVRLVPDRTLGDADVAAVGGSLEVPLTPEAVKRLGLAHDEPVELVLRRPGQS